MRSLKKSIYVNSIWAEVCYRTAEKITLKEVSYYTIDNSEHIKNHILVCGFTPSISQFVIPLRMKYLSEIIPIVILYKKPLCEKDWNSLCYFPKIYYIKGSALVKGDLIRANINYCRKVVIFSNMPESSNSKQGSDEFEDGPTIEANTDMNKIERLIDAETIFQYKAIKKVKPNLEVSVEIINPDNMIFMLSSPNEYLDFKTYGFDLTKTFASGEVYISSIIDKLMCQTYYDQAYLSVLNQLVLGNPSQDKNKKFKNSNLYPMHFIKDYVVRQLTRTSNLIRCSKCFYLTTISL